MSFSSGLFTRRRKDTLTKEERLKYTAFCDKIKQTCKKLDTMFDDKIGKFHEGSPEYQQAIEQFEDNAQVIDMRNDIYKWQGEIDILLQVEDIIEFSNNIGLHYFLMNKYPEAAVPFEVLNIIIDKPVCQEILDICSNEEQAASTFGYFPRVMKDVFTEIAAIIEKGNLEVFYTCE